MLESLHFRATGSGEAVILLHGLFGSGDNLAGLARALADQFQVFALDLRNHGQSFWHDSMTYAEMAADIAAFMAQQSLPKARIVGHSMGGKIAMQLALQQPELVERLLIADIAPVDYPPHHSTILAALDEVLAAKTSVRSEAGDILARHIADPGVRGFLLKSLCKRDQGRLGWKFNLHAIERNYTAIMQGQQGQPYNGACLFIKGENSDYLLPEYQGQVQHLFPAASLRVISGTGHWLHAEKPAVFNSLVQRFLSA